jgi:hypothetical protein
MSAFILDAQGAPLAELEIERIEDDFKYFCRMRRHSFPPELLERFLEYEDIIRHQTFSMEDECRDNIAAFGLQLSISGLVRRIDEIQTDLSSGKASSFVYVEAET